MRHRRRRLCARDVHYRVKFYGQTVHAGTFPMPKRRDAFYAAAQALCNMHDEIDKLGIKDLVYTTGEVVCHPCVHTCVPDYFDFSVDARHEDPDLLAKVLEVVMSLADRQWAGCRCEVVKAWNRDTVYWNKKLVGYVEESATEAGVSHMRIHSGAGSRRSVRVVYAPDHDDFRPVEGRTVPLRAGVFQPGALHGGRDCHARRGVKSGQRLSDMLWDVYRASPFSICPYFRVIRNKTLQHL